MFITPETVCKGVVFIFLVVSTNQALIKYTYEKICLTTLQNAWFQIWLKCCVLFLCTIYRFNVFSSMTIQLNTCIQLVQQGIHCTLPLTHQISDNRNIYVMSKIIVFYLVHNGVLSLNVVSFQYNLAITNTLILDRGSPYKHKLVGQIQIITRVVILCKVLIKRV